ARRAHPVPAHAEDLEVAQHVGREARPHVHPGPPRHALELRRSAFRLLRQLPLRLLPAVSGGPERRYASDLAHHPQKIQDRTRTTRPMTRISQAAVRSADHTPVNPSSASRMRMMPITSRTSMFPPRAG